MSRKHKSRKPKITQSNVPAAVAKETEKPQVQSDVQNETALPENHNNTEQSATAASTSPISEKTETVQSHDDYSLDAHYAAQENKNDDANQHITTPNLTAASAHAENMAPNDPEPAAVSGSLNSETAASLNEYEQLKRKNRRRLVGAGALVLVAGSLFAAASKDSTQSNPKLSTTKVVEQQVLQPEILRPAGSENKIDLSIDDEKTAPLVLKNNAMSGTQNRNNAAAASPQNANRNNTMLAQNTKNSTTSSNNTQSAADRSKAREEARAAEERRKKAHSKANEAEAKRQEAERIIANKAKIAQAAADRNRNAERAQLTVERAAEEKQRAQRQAAASTSSKSSNGGGGSKAIQAGAFSDREAARRMQQQLKNLNYAARVEEVQTSKGKIYRVRTGDFNNQTDAKNALNKLQNKGVNAMVVGK